MIKRHLPTLQRCSWHPAYLPPLCSSGELKLKLREVGRIVKGYPSVLCYPLLLLALLLGLGTWAVIHVVQADISSAQVRASSIARDTAAWYVQQLSLALGPLSVMSAIVRYKPQYWEARSLFLPLAPSLLAQAPGKSIVNLQLVPHGVVTDMYPQAGQEAALGLDLFAAASDQDGAVKTARDGVVTLIGPIEFVQGGHGIILRQPIFVHAASPNETFNISAPVNPYCGEPCAFNRTTGNAFWGFAAVLISLANLNGSHSRLGALRDGGYAYQLLAPNSIPGGFDVVVGTSEHKLGPSAVEVPVQLPNCQWLLRVYPLSGWAPSWMVGMLVAVILISVSLAALTFMLLVSRQQHQLLLNALLPKDMIRELRREPAAALGGTRIMEAETPADMLLGMLGQLLEGRIPDLRDVVFIRTALMRNMDVYSPLNLKKHIKSANLDADVVSALMQQLGRGAEVQHSGSSMMPYCGDDPEYTGIRKMAAQQISDDLATYEAPSAGLQLVLGLQQTHSREGGSIAQNFADVSADSEMGVYPSHWEATVHGVSAGVGIRLGGSVSSSGVAGAVAPTATAAIERSTLPNIGFGSSAVLAPVPPVTTAAVSCSGRQINGSTASAPSLAMPTVALLTVPFPIPTAAASLQTEGLEHDGDAAGCGGSGGGAQGRGMAVGTGRARRLSIVTSSLGQHSRQSLPAPSHILISSTVIEESERLLAGADRWQFNTWALQEATQGHALSALGFYLIQKAGLIKAFQIKPVTLARLLRQMEAGYLDNPYHNAVHAADVLQTLHVIIHATQLHVHYLDHLGLLAAYYAAIVHDYGHPGMTNDFLVAISDPLAVRYNDRSPLENHHCAASFGLLQRPELDFLAPLSPSERAGFRKMVIEMVLATDMKQHFSILSHFNTVHRLAAYSQQQQQQQQQQQPLQQQQSRQQSLTNGTVLAAPNCQSRSATALRNLVNSEKLATLGSISPSSIITPPAPTAPKPVDETERLLSLQMALKAADIGHLGEELEVHKRWLGVLEEEFFRQGDRERELGLSISPLFDRAKQGVSKSQVGFYDFVALPLVHALSSAFPGAHQLMMDFIHNYNHWRQVDEQLPVQVAPAVATAAASGGGTCKAGGGSSGIRRCQTLLPSFSARAATTQSTQVTLASVGPPPLCASSSDRALGSGSKSSLVNSGKDSGTADKARQAPAVPPHQLQSQGAPVVKLVIARD